MLTADSRGHPGAQRFQARAVAKAVCLLDLDPDLGTGIELDDRQAARRATGAHVIEVARGEWEPPLAIGDDEVLGLIVDDGLLSREVTLNNHIGFELLGPCDVLLPAAPMPDNDGWGRPTTLCVLSPARVIVLGTPFIYAAARWPALLTNLHRRLEATRRRVALQGLAAHLPRAEDRVLLTLRLLADGCGRVTAEGTVIPLSLSHDALGRLTAARRPTITLALRALKAADYVHRGSDGGFILTPAVDRRIEELMHPSNQLPPLGARIAPHATRRRPPVAV
jgi:CRP-like cAMP-binding protein